MNDLTLRPMTDQEYHTWYRHSLRGYVEALTSSGYCTAAEAEDRATSQYQQLLPQGRQSCDHALLVAEHEGVRIGMVWLAARPSGAFIYDIEVDRAHRGRGFGRALLAAAEGWARDHDLASIGLHVFADNRAAWHLYTSSGYQMTSANFSKDL